MIESFTPVILESCVANQCDSFGAVEQKQLVSSDVVRPLGLQAIALDAGSQLDTRHTASTKTELPVQLLFDVPNSGGLFGIARLYRGLDEGIGLNECRGISVCFRHLFLSDGQDEEHCAHCSRANEGKESRG